ncbi:hypothetical protein CGQ24_16820 [Arthrobacter sp. 7749]|nr:hypothetical protein CGQ24_16820 [Arthrobacter sp. 7749]
MLKWLGFSGERPEGEVPFWAGLPRGLRWLVGALWLAVAAGFFTLLQLRLPESDWGRGFLPILVASVVFAMGSAATERGMVRIRAASSEG